MRKAIKVSTGVKAGGFNYQHNRKLRIKTGINKAGGAWGNHNRNLRIKTAIKAGGA